MDPSFLSLSLGAGHGSVPKAMMFQHMLEPAGTALSDLRLALAVDHSASTAFAEAAAGFPRTFVEPYLAERIERGELFLYEERGEILASGECRRRNMKPLCSTEPANLAARRVIHKAGFRARHRVFRVTLG